jgi:DeoR/GlpR family transcriptional regulator of sugar metabolism
MITAVKVDVRRALIEERVLDAGEVEFGALASELGVSEMTIRRDIDVLEERGILRRVAGGAIAFAGRGNEPPYRARALAAVGEKQDIAAGIVGLLHRRETVIVDSGSSALAVARAIRGRALNLTVVTPSLLAALELADDPGTDVVLLGGRLRQGELSLIGSDTLEGLGRYNCDTFVMGIAGLDAVKGASDYHQEEAAVKRAGIDAANRVIVAADASKLGSVYLARVAPLTALDILVTDGADDHPTILAAKKAGVEVVTVG